MMTISIIMRQELQKLRVFGAGYSGLDMEDLLSALLDRGITMLIDIRSRPLSRHRPEFSKSNLAHWVASVGIQYVHAGKSIGGKLANEGFDETVSRIALMARDGERICLLCVEPRQQDCHRGSVIAPALAAHGVALKELIEKKRIWKRR